jgi:hypothetical protein
MGNFPNWSRKSDWMEPVNLQMVSLTHLKIMSTLQPVHRTETLVFAYRGLQALR